MLKTLQTNGSLVRGARALSASPVTVTSGRGGRSSTNGHTVTVFGATGRMGRYLVNSLGQLGTQIIIPHRCDPYSAQYLKVNDGYELSFAVEYELLDFSRRRTLFLGDGISILCQSLIKISEIFK